MAQRSPLNKFPAGFFWKMLREESVSVLSGAVPGQGRRPAQRCPSFQVLDVPRVLGMLRQQRMAMVQTLCQYTFVYRVLVQFLKSSRLI